MPSTRRPPVVPAALAAIAATVLLAACGGGGSDAGSAGAADAGEDDVRAVALGVHDTGRALPVCPAPTETLVDITAVQGPGATSPIEGRRVSVRGIVTADFRASGGIGGLFIQQARPDDDPRTSEGLYVFTIDATALVPGDYVQVTGTVNEFRRSGGDPLTQLAGDPVLERCGAAALPKPRALTLPVTGAEAFERHEGMFVRFPQPLVVSGNFALGRFGELVLSPHQRLYHANNHPELAPDAARDYNARARIVLDDTSGVQNPAPIPFLSAADASGTRRTGDRVHKLEGVLSHDFGAWRVQPTEAPQFMPRNERTEAPKRVGGTLRVASLNVLNWFTTLGQRGASSAEELQRQQAKLVETIVALDADVLGLIEIENNDGVALRALVDAVNTRLGAPVYEFRSPGIPGTDLITEAVIYRSARVAAVGNPQVPNDPDFGVDGGMRPPVAQRFASLANGGGFWFVVNHLKSKGSCPSDAARPDADLGQGCWNASRVRQAQALTRWVDVLVAGSGEADVLMAGDFNAYLNEDPLAVLRGAGHEVLLERLPPAQRYSYVFESEAGALDHALASASLSSQVTGLAVWHTNADEPPVLDYNLEFKTDDRWAPTPYRASDHDPVVVGLRLHADLPAAAPTLRAQLPTAASATQAVAIEAIAAEASPGATGVALSVDWGDGTGAQLLAAASTRAEHAYAAAGAYRIALTLAQDGSLPAVLSVPISVASPPVVAQPGLVISEYIEGSSFNKAIELYNPGATAADLSRYTLRLYSNGALNATQSLTLGGLLAPGATYVLCHPGIAAAALPACQATSSAAINFNGDDALTLELDGMVVDQFGQVGFDPGTAWADGALSTLDRTLRRKPGVVQGSVPPAAPGVWGFASEWDELPVNTLDGLGSR
jgi:predicted extracellular nuclease